MHELSTKIWTLSGDAWLTPDSVVHIILEVRFCLSFYWSLSRPISGVGLVCPPTSRMVVLPLISIH